MSHFTSSESANVLRAFQGSHQNVNTQPGFCGEKNISHHLPTLFASPDIFNVQKCLLMSSCLGLANEFYTFQRRTKIKYNAEVFPYKLVIMGPLCFIILKWQREPICSWSLARSIFNAAFLVDYIFFKLLAGSSAHITKVRYSGLESRCFSSLIVSE
jgi:hypothetical protein